MTQGNVLNHCFWILVNCIKEWWKVLGRQPWLFIPNPKNCAMSEMFTNAIQVSIQLASSWPEN